MLGQSLRLKPVPIQSLSELERARLQEVVCSHLEKRELDCKISIPREIRKRRKSLRRRFDSFSKERKERESAPKAFGIALSQVIANDRAHKQRQDALKESRRDCLDLEASILHFRAEKQQQQQPPGSGKPPSPTAIPSLEAHGEPVSPAFPDNTSRAHRRGGMSVDCISDLVESQSRLLEALQLSHPYELEAKKAAGRGQGKLSLNPIYRQVPRVVELCCRHIEAHGLQTVGIFRVGSSKKRVRQLREDFDQGADVFLDREHSVHDVAALLKEFLRDMLDPLLPRELYPAFLHANSLRGEEQLQYLQLLLCLLPPCNCDTLWRLLSLLHTVHCHAQDTVGPDCQEVPGNKMTAANLAVIFGPNLLQKERGSERDLSLQAVGMEDNSGVICVTLLLILHYKQLFMVSAELQQEVLVSLLQTDPDVINYLLRRKVSGSYPEMEVDAGGRRSTKSSLDSVGTSSWDSSPLEPPSSFYSETHEESARSSEVLLNALRLQQIQNRSSEDRLGKSIGRIRQFHSHHNLLSLARPPPRALGEDRERAGKSGSWEEDSRAAKGGFAAERAVLFSVGENYREPLTLVQKDNAAWVKPRVMSAPGPEDGKPIATNLWDFLTRKVPSSETIL